MPKENIIAISKDESDKKVTSEYGIPHIIRELTEDNYKATLDELFCTNDDDIKNLPKDHVEI